MATYTLTTTVGQEAALTEAVAIANARDGTSLTNAQYVTNVATPALIAEVQNLRSFKKTTGLITLTTAYQGATQTVQDQVEALLGISI